MQPNDSTCNGWANYATWRVNLELIADQIDSLTQDITAGYREPFTGLADLADYLAELCSDYVTEFDTRDDIATQYATAFLNQVNWYEIAENHAQDSPNLVVERHL